MNKNKETARFIVVEGPIGVGKTTLARRLAGTFNVDLMLENAVDNPFLPRFYENPESVALATQLHFLFQRSKMVAALKQTDMFKPAQVSDFLLQRDKLFAEAILDTHELELYYQVYNSLLPEAPVPDLVIYLQAPVEVLMQRISGSGAEYAKQISEEYLRKIADAYIEFFYYYHDAPLLIVNTTDFNLADDKDADGGSDYNVLLDYIRDLKSGRHYFNPQELWRLR